ncbi:protein SRC2 homolog [Momordica charantia]|uniref:Protein SRC2 homolog n=1 Tax=Momordica charantia TaxID=3673 RepID=A0A6J1D3B5_MOMCH|nr:protein SRC2 homolog [Momordica charantia]XP_022147784.1 protein SRC2 homolog [Momordica charantia]
MSTYAIQGQPLEVTVIGCTKLKDTEWISRQDPYVLLEYGSTKFRTTTCTDGGRNPTFQEKFVFSLIEGLREINVAVWNSNTVTYDDFIGNGKIQLAKVLSEGYDDSAWSLQTKTGRHAGEVRLILHFATATKPSSSFTPSAPPFQAPAPPHVPVYATMPPPPSHTTAYPPPTSTPYSFPPSPFPSYPPSSVAYQTSMYSPYPSGYPPSSYPPPPLAYPPTPYPPPPQASPFYPPGPYPGVYPPPQY